MPRILVVDDEPGRRRSLAISLQGEGHEVEEGAGGTEALQRLEREIYDLVMRDRRLAPLANAGTLRAAGHDQAPGRALASSFFGYCLRSW